jgi:hypothetical protein
VKSIWFDAFVMCVSHTSSEIIASGRKKEKQLAEQLMTRRRETKQMNRDVDVGRQ